MERIGVVHGRFQILHNDHMKYILAGKNRCEHLVIGITNPDPSLTSSDATNLERSLDSSNPLSYLERYWLVKAALIEEGMDYTQFSVIPFPINFPKLYRYYVPVEAMFYLTIYDDWGRRKLQLLSENGLRTEILWDRPADQKGLTGSRIRNLIADGGKWESFVPLSVAELIKKWNIASRLKKLR
ncbi:MAG: nicotinate-nucleotide adenylyltransferase [Syntrophaceae bacterium]|nr:nicotinate-nucleotide adenylyltransferase [Syntrophaceae bacterium]